MKTRRSSTRLRTLIHSHPVDFEAHGILEPGRVAAAGAADRLVEEDVLGLPEGVVLARLVGGGDCEMGATIAVEEQVDVIAVPFQQPIGDVRSVCPR